MIGKSDGNIVFVKNGMNVMETKRYKLNML
jgi:hypothetical protein